MEFDRVLPPFLERNYPSGAYRSTNEGVSWDTTLGVLAMTKRKKLHGSVKKVIKSPIPSEPEKAEIEIHEAEDLYKEIRIENVVTNEEGKKDKLKEGEDVDLIVEAEPKKNKQKP